MCRKRKTLGLLPVAVCTGQACCDCSSCLPSRQQTFVHSPPRRHRHAVPAAFRLAEDPRTELRSCTALLMQALHTLLGDALVEHSLKAPASVQNRVNEMLQLR